MPKIKTIRLTLLFVLLVTSLLAACSPKPTPIPYATLDLNQVMLTQADLPDGFDVVIAGKPEDLFPNAPAVHTGVVNAATTILKTSDSNKVFSNGILVYDTEELATSAFQSIIDQTKGEKLTIDPVGDDTFAIYSTVSGDMILNTIHVAMILWRTGPVVVYLSSADSRNPPDPEQMPSLAKLIQSRLAGSQAQSAAQP